MKTRSLSLASLTFGLSLTGLSLAGCGGAQPAGETTQKCQCGGECKCSEGACQCGGGAAAPGSDGEKSCGGEKGCGGEKSCGGH